MQRAGTREDLGTLLVQHLPQLRSFVKKRMGPTLGAHESVSDVAQSICRQLLSTEREFEFQGEAAFRSWLFLQASRRLTDRGRYWTAARRRGPVGGGVDPSRHAQLVSDVTPSRCAVGRERMRAFTRAFESLSSDQQRVLSLCRGMGLTAVEAAERLGKKPATVRVTLHRALARLAVAEARILGR